MKKIFYIAVLLAIVACEDKYENKHKYSHPYYLTKDYPILLDASEILLGIQVKPPVNPNEAFKIVSNDKYFFVGEKMDGIHVYEKIDEFHVNPLCFIECKYMKAFDVEDDILYCNDFIDLLVIDVENPLQAKIKHREKGYFNNYLNNNLNLSIYSSSDTNIYYEIEYKRIVLEGIETDTNPPPDFSEYDKLYSNIIVKEILDTLQMLGKPYVGIVNIKGKIHTFGYNSLVTCSYANDFLETEPVFNYVWDNSMPPCDLRYKDNLIYIFGKDGFRTSLSLQYQNWMSHIPLDAVTISNYLSIALSKEFIACFYAYMTITTPSLGATSLININDTILALGEQLTLYRFVVGQFIESSHFELVKEYSDISGLCMIRNEDVLIVANKQGLSFYDISDLENIKIMP